MTEHKGAPKAAPQRVVELVSIFCPKCGNAITHQRSEAGKRVGLLSGAAAGAALGAKVGIVAGPLGAMAGTIPGALFGAVFGRAGGRKLDRILCKRCGTSFDMP